MPTKIFHPDHGFVLTGDQHEVDALVAKGGKIVIKNNEINKKPEIVNDPESPSKSQAKRLSVMRGH